MFLALYLIVLAFFILLNAISHRQEDRSKAVLGSLGATFAEPAMVSTGPLSFVSGSGVFAAIGEFETSVRGLFQAAFPLARVAAYQPFEKLQIEVPVESLFEPGSDSLKADRDEFMGRLATILQRRVPGRIFGVDVLFSLPSDQARLATPVRSLALARAGHFARALGALGVTSDHVSTGIEEGDPATLQLQFLTREFDDEALSSDRQIDE